MTSTDGTSQDSPGTGSRTLGRRVLTAYLAFGIAVGIPALAYAALYWVLLVVGDADSGEGWGILIAMVLGFLAALVLAFVLHIVVARRLRLGWIHALTVVPLGLVGALIAGPGTWPGSDQSVWTVVTALAAPAVVGLLTAPGLARRTRWLASGAAVLLLGLTMVADQAAMGLLHLADVRAQAADCPDPLLAPPPDSPWVPQDLQCVGGEAQISLRQGNDRDEEVLVFLAPVGSPFYGDAPEVHGSYVTFEYSEHLGMPEEEFAATLEPVAVDEFAQRAFRLSQLFGNR